MMKNNKMKKMVSLFVAMMMVCSVLTLHAGAAQSGLGWYEFTGSSTSGEFDTPGCSGWANGSDGIVYEAFTTAMNSDVEMVEVGVSWTTNVDPEYDPLYDYGYSYAGEAYAHVDGNGYIASDYEIYASSSSHYVRTYNGESELFCIGTGI